MRICFVVNKLDFFISHRLDLAIALSKTNRVSVITNSEGASKKNIERLLEHNIILYELKERQRSVNFFSYLNYARSLRKIVKRTNPNFIYFVTLETSFFGSLVSYGMNIQKNFYLITGLGSFFFNSKIKYRFARFIHKIAFQLSKFKNNHFFIFQNAEDLSTFVDLGFAKKSQTILIHGNGIDVRYFAFHKRPPKKQITFLFASRLNLSKGLSEFLLAADEILIKYDSTKFMIAGEYNRLDPDSISEKTFNMILNSNKFEYLGHLPHEEMRECFNNASIFVLPSHGEGLPKASLEAASTGLPIITTDVRGCKETVDNNKNGLLVKPGNVQELKNAMESFILMNPSTLSNYGKRSSEMVKTKFSLDLIANEYLKLLEN